MPQGLSSTKFERMKERSHAATSGDPMQGLWAHRELLKTETSILIVNPNSTSAMTDALKPSVAAVFPKDMEVTYFTAPPEAPPSINDEETSKRSAEVCLPVLKPMLDKHGGVVIACFSAHPLVPALRSVSRKPIVGIFEAAVMHALQLLLPGQKLGIVSTGDEWKPLLTAGVEALLGGVERFGGVATTGVPANELHKMPKEELEAKMKDATRELLEGSEAISVVLLGCAGMVGLEAIVASAATELDRDVRIVDGVRAAVGEATSMVRCGYWD